MNVFVRHIATFLLVPLSLVCSCTREEVDKPSGKEEVVVSTIHYRATVEENAPTRASLNAYKEYVFELGDELYVQHGTDMYGFLSLVAGEGSTTGTFEGDLMIVNSNYQPKSSDVLTATLVGHDDKLYTRNGNGTLSGPNYSTSLYADSFDNAIRWFSDFQGTGNYGDHAFTLYQNSTFVIFSVSFNEELGDVSSLDATFKNNVGGQNEATLWSASDVPVHNKQSIFVTAFAGDGITLNDASITFSKGTYTQTWADISSATLAKNKYYTIERSLFDDKFFTIRATEDDTEIMFNYTDKSLQYQKNGDGNWVNVTSSTIPLSADDYIEVRGIATSYNNENGTANKVLFVSNNLCYIYGDIMSLVRKANYEERTASDFGSSSKNFSGLFYNTSTPVNYIDIPSGRPLKLNAPVTKASCFASMFKNCTSLTRPPKFPNVDIAGSACSNMFEGCTSLMAAPNLPATSVDSKGYKSMFKGCTSLATAPASLAGTSTDECCLSMFEGCTALTIAPELPATTVGVSGYQSMFKGCTRLIATPALPAGTIGASAYYSTFEGCTSLVTAPSTLGATLLANNCYKKMFYGCTALTSVPDLPATNADNPADGCYYQMFYNCSHLNMSSATGWTLGLTTIGYQGCKEMFYGCTQLVRAPQLTNVTIVGNEGCYQMFRGCVNLYYPPVELNAGASGNGSVGTSGYYAMFYQCEKLTETPDIKAVSLPSNACKQMFYGCKRLTTVRGNLLPTVASESVYSGMFQGCTSLTTAPELPATTLNLQSYYYMFSGSGITKAPDLPATTLAQQCYQGMFAGCKSLEGPVLLPAGTLAVGSYKNMFDGATKLNYVICLATDISASDCTYQWLKSVSATGNFRYATGYGLSSEGGIWDLGVSGIPTSWVYKPYGLEPIFPGNPFDPEEDL